MPGLSRPGFASFTYRCERCYQLHAPSPRGGPEQPEIASIQLWQQWDIVGGGAIRARKRVRKAQAPLSQLTSFKLMLPLDILTYTGCRFRFFGLPDSSLLVDLVIKAVAMCPVEGHRAYLQQEREVGGPREQHYATFPVA